MPTFPLQALIFDVDGTLADTEDLHRRAFNDAFARAGLDWHWSREVYARLLDVAGGRERIAHYRATRRRGHDPRTIDREVAHLHRLKTDAYERLIEAGSIGLRPGVAALIESASDAGLRLAIATTTTPANVDALLGAALGDGWRVRFEVVEDAGTAPRKKPHPQAYLQALSRLGLPPEACIAFEDSGNGLHAARGAGLETIVTPNEWTADHDFAGALRVLPDLAGVTPGHLRNWHGTTVH